MLPSARIITPALSAIATMGLLTISQSAAAITTENVDYQVNNQTYEGYYAKADTPNAPFILLIHDWDGLTDYERMRADMLAERGYNVFAADMFGKGVRPTATEDKKRLTGELYEDRNKMRQILTGALNAGRLEGNDVRQGVTMGYCFGGSVALELARAGFPQKAFVSFHGGLDTPPRQDYSNTKGEILVLHGSADQSVSMDDFATLGKTLETADVPHEMITYSGAPHAFSEMGSDRYDERADKRSWARYMSFLDELYPNSMMMMP